MLCGPGTLASETRQAAALDAPGLSAKVRGAACEVTDADLQAGQQEFSQDQLFELVVSAALGAARLRLNRALEALCD